MRNSNGGIIAMHLPLRLTPEEMERPEMVVEGFFGTFCLSETRAFLWDLLSKAICCSDEDLDGFSRNDMLAFYEELEMLIEAAYVQHSRGKESAPAPGAAAAQS